MIIKNNLFIVVMLFVILFVMVGDFLFGVGVVFNELFYKGYNENIIVVLLISYEGD